MNTHHSLLSDCAPSPRTPGSAFTPSLFHTLPPERIGLNGEYDYDGLSKRVLKALTQKLGQEAIAHLSLSQRGAMVVLKGNFYEPSFLYDLISLALQTDGAVGVEVNGRTILPHIDRDSLNSQVVSLCAASLYAWGQDQN